MHIKEECAAQRSALRDQRIEYIALVKVARVAQNKMRRQQKEEGWGPTSA